MRQCIKENYISIRSTYNLCVRFKNHAVEHCIEKYKFKIINAAYNTHVKIQ
jgi:hypothetical protein